MFDKLINKIGTDKLLHFAFGAVISFAVTNIVMLQEGAIGTGNLWFAVIGVLVSLFFGCLKEFIFDSEADMKDLAATVIGGAVPFVVNAVGVLFYILS